MGVKLKERPKGSGVWWIFINHNGKRKAKKIGKDKRTATEAARKIEARLTLGEWDIEKETVKQPTFNECAKLWLSMPHDWKESTRDSYAVNLKNHVLPCFSKTPINEILRKDLKAFFDKKYAEGLNVGTLKLIRAPINGVFSFAVESEHIESNPLRDFSLKYKRKKFEIDPLTEPETILLLEQAKVFLGGAYYPVILTAVRTGMRIGEIQALKWDDIDFEKRQIEVRRSYRNYRLTDTKNHKSRHVDMTPHLTETLKAHQTAQKRAALKAGKPFSEFVFTGTRDEMLNRISYQNALNRCSKKAGLRHVGAHSLRHSYATIRLMKGHNIGDVSYQLGHSSIKITYDVYAHWLPGQFKSEVDDLDQMQPDATQAQPKKEAI
ncbi:MAG: tyrosine-type recombinase/integrase [Pseudomonadota bacterium]|nr:site-specific integrase [Pseudomonadota bacterium]